MNKEEKYLDLIERFLAETATEQEVDQVKNLMKSDADFKALYETEKMVHDAVVLSELKEIEKEVYAFEPVRKSFLKKYWWAIGLAIASTVGVFVLLIPQESLPETKKEEKIKPVIIKEAKPEEIIEKEQFSVRPKEIEPYRAKDIVQEDKNITELKIDAVSVDTGGVIVPSPDVDTTLNDNLEKIGVTKDEPFNPCDTTIISFKTFVEKACEEQEDGAIYVQNISGGTLPYEIIFEDDLDMAFLPSGVYNLQIKDKNGCQSDIISIEVASTNCDEPEEYTISNSQGGWVEFQQEGRLQIISEFGRIVFDTQIESGYKWYGTSASGDYLGMGTYNYRLSGDSGEQSGVINVLE